MRLGGEDNACSLPSTKTLHFARSRPALARALPPGPMSAPLATRLALIRSPVQFWPLVLGSGTTPTTMGVPLGAEGPAVADGLGDAELAATAAGASAVTASASIATNRPRLATHGHLLFILASLSSEVLRRGHRRCPRRSPIAFRRSRHRSVAAWQNLRRLLLHREVDPVVPLLGHRGELAVGVHLLDRIVEQCDQIGLGKLGGEGEVLVVERLAGELDGLALQDGLLAGGAGGHPEVKVTVEEIRNSVKVGGIRLDDGLRLLLQVVIGGGLCTNSDRL